MSEQPPVQSADPRMLKEIKAQAIASLVISLLSFSPLGVVLAPFAYYRGRKALRLIEETGVGKEYKGIAQIGKIIGLIAMLLIALSIIAYVVLMLVIPLVLNR